MKVLIQSGADVTVINNAGHDAVFEAEINDKKEVSDWLLGAVEELEKGVGQTEEGTPDDAVDAMDIEVSSNSTTKPGESGASTVDEVGKKVDTLQIKDQSSNDG